MVTTLSVFAMCPDELASLVRAQYHLRQTPLGLDAWGVRRLIVLARTLPVIEIDPNAIAELDRDHWFFHSDDEPTPRRFVEHMRLVNEADLAYPIILDASGKLMDGMHRVCRAVLEGREHIRAVQFDLDPAPDFTNCDPALLPYDGERQAETCFRSV